MSARTHRGCRGGRRRPAPIAPAAPGPLDHLVNPPLHHTARKADRIALSWYRCDGRPLIEAPIGPIADYRLLVLRHQVDPRHPDIHRRVSLPLLAYALAVDPETARLSLACVAASDLACPAGPQGGLPADTPPHVVNLAQDLFDAADDAPPGAGDLAPILPPVYFGFAADPVVESPDVAPTLLVGRVLYPAAAFARRPGDAYYDTCPVTGSPNPTPVAARVGRGFQVDGWARRDGYWFPRAQEPVDVLVDLSSQVGRTCRNPAFEALRKHGLIDPVLRLGAFRKALETRTPGVAPFVDDEGPPVAAFRALVNGYHDLAGLVADFQAVCVRRDIAFAADPAGDPVDACLMAPWRPVTMGGESRIQVVRLAGRACAATLVFPYPNTTLDLHDAGRWHRRFEVC